MIYLCRHCWKETAEELSTCPHCGADQGALESESFVQKLIRALDHPEPETPVRAAYILGELQAVEAIPKLAKVMRTSGDPYIAAASAQALGRIGGPESLAELERMADSKSLSLMVREAVRKALERANKREHNTTPR